MNTVSSFPQIPHTLLCNGFQSRMKMFNVLSYSPQAGQSGTTVTIDTLFHNFNWLEDVHIRILIGREPIHTEIKSLGENFSNLWRCTGFVPEFKAHKNSSIHTVDVTIQAVDKRNALLDAITIGRFTYQEHGKCREFSISSPVVLKYFGRSFFVRAWRLRYPPQGQFMLVRHAAPYCSF
jgi:hypothetical protein